MKKYLFSIITLLVVLSSCQKEDDILTPITQPTQTNTTNTNGDTTTIISNPVDSLGNIDTTTTTTTNTRYKLVKCTFEYTDYDNQSNNVSYFGYPYNEYGTTIDFSTGPTSNDTLTVNMPMYPAQYMIQPTIPLYLPNGEAEWFQLIVNDVLKTENYVDINVDIKRVICSQIIHDLQFRFFITENNGELILTLTDMGVHWTTTQTMRFEPM